jgi:hypothetical protein
MLIIACRNLRNKVQVCRPSLFRRRQIYTFHAGSKTGSGLGSGSETVLKVGSGCEQIISVPQDCLTVQKCTLSHLGIGVLDTEPEIKCNIPDLYWIRTRIR